MIHMKIAYDGFMLDVEEEISFELDGSVPSSAETAQEIWRRQGQRILRQGERLMNLSKEFLAMAR